MLHLALIFSTLLGSQYMQPALVVPQNEWQWMDDKSGLVFPWFTKPFLDVLVTWNMEDWDIFEWGSGYSTIWFASHCHSVVSIDNDNEWVCAIKKQLASLKITNTTLKCRAGKPPYGIGEGGEDSDIVQAINEDDKLYDCIIIDGLYHRNACAIEALKHIKPSGIIILDNANQASIGLNSAKTFELLQKYRHFSYLQPGHPDWRTDYWVISSD